MAEDNENFEALKKMRNDSNDISEVVMTNCGADEAESRKLAINRIVSEAFGGVRVSFNAIDKLYYKSHTTLVSTGQNFNTEKLGGANKFSRYIPIKIKQHIKEHYGDKCAVKNCKQRARNIHHEKLFSIYKSHDPRFLKPLCRAHHELVHFDGDVCL